MKDGLNYTSAVDFVNALNGGMSVQVISPGHGSYGGKFGRWGYDNRQIDRHVFYCLTKGSLQVTWSGAATTVNAGDVLWISAGVRHSLSLAKSDKPISLFHTQARFISSETPCRPEIDVIHRSDTDRLRGLFEELVTSERFPSVFQEQRRRAIFLLIASELLMTQKPSGGLTLSQRRRIEALIATSRGKFLSSKRLAREAGLTPTYFARQFAVSYGQQPRSWLVHQRIRDAASQLLESTASISSIARQFGYEDPYLFSRQFTAVMGLSPRAYRQS